MAGIVCSSIELSCYPESGESALSLALDNRRFNVPCKKLSNNKKGTVEDFTAQMKVASSYGSLDVSDSVQVSINSTLQSSYSNGVITIIVPKGTIFNEGETYLTIGTVSLSYTPQGKSKRTSNIDICIYPDLTTAEITDALNDKITAQYITLAELQAQIPNKANVEDLVTVNSQSLINKGGNIDTTPTTMTDNDVNEIFNSL